MIKQFLSTIMAIAFVTTLFGQSIVQSGKLPGQTTTPQYLHKKNIEIPQISRNSSTKNTKNILFEENFENDWLPIGWQSYSLGTEGAWEQGYSSKPEYNSHAYHNDNISSDNVDSWLVSPSITIPATDSYDLVFHHVSIPNYESTKIMISKGSGNPNDGEFTLLKEFSTMNTAWKKQILNIADYAGETIYVAFRVNHGYSSLRVDNIKVSLSSYFDGATSNIEPNGFTTEGSIQDVLVTVQNKGAETIGDINIDWWIDGVKQPRYTKYSAYLTVDQEETYKIGSFDFSREKIYEIQASVEIADDANQSNDTLIKYYSVGMSNDLIIENISPNGNYPIAGERNVDVTIKNIGELTIDSIQANLVINDSVFAPITLSKLNLTPNSTQIINLVNYSFEQGVSELSVNIPVDYDLTDWNNTMTKNYGVGGLYEDFQADFPPLLWETKNALKGNWLAQNQDPLNYHIDLVAVHNLFGDTDDTLYSPLLNIQVGDSIRFKTIVPILYPGSLSLIWKNGSTGEVETLKDNLPVGTEWAEQVVDISAAAGANYIGWVCTSATIGDVDMDDISSTATLFLYDNDLLLKKAKQKNTRTPVLNNEEIFEATIKNVGKNIVPGTSYSVNLREVNQVSSTLLVSMAGKDIKSFDELLFEIPYAFTTAGNHNVFVEIEFNNDQETSNNYSTKIMVNPVPTNAIQPTIGEQEHYSYYVPFNFVGNEMFGGDQDLSQTIYYNHEIGTPGYIHGMKFPYHNEFSFGSSMDVKVWVGATTKTHLNEGWFPHKDLTLVFDSTIITYHGYDDFIYINFNEPYYYDGLQNLIVQNYAKDPTFLFSASKVLATKDSVYSRTLKIVDEEIIDPANPPFSHITGWADEEYPVTTFVIVPNENTGIISGTVKDANNAIVPNAEVFIANSSISELTDDSGAYETPGLPYNDYSFTATKFGYYNDNKSIKLESTTAELNFTLVKRPNVTISGKVFGSDNTDIPLNNVKISMSGYVSRITNSDTEGAFMFDAAYADTIYYLEYELWGYEIRYDTIAVLAENLDLGNIILNEITYPAFNVTANLLENSAEVEWVDPANVEYDQLQNDDDYRFDGFANEPNENVWMGNKFANNELITITDVDIDWFGGKLGHSGNVSVDVLNNAGEIIATSDFFATPYDSLINVELPNIAVKEDFFIMVHWKDNPETTHYLTYSYQVNNFLFNTAYIKFADTDPVLLNEYYSFGTEDQIDLSFLIRPNIIRQANKSRAVQSYDIYRGLSSDMLNVDQWEKVNSELISNTSFTDSNLPSDLTNAFSYAVRALYNNNLESEASFSNSLRIFHDAPVNLTIDYTDFANGTAILNWESPNNYVLSYNVFIDDMGTAVGQTTETSYAFNNLEPGEYIVGVSAHYSTGESEIETETIVSITGDEASSIKFYPNPASNELTLLNSEKAIVVIYDITGKIQYTSNIVSPIETLNISTLENGVYIIEIIKANSSLKETLIIE